MDENAKLYIPYPIIVEGKYDKIKLCSVLRARVFVTDGFGVFRDKEKACLFRALAAKSPVIVATDPDGAGLVIRNYFNSTIPRDRLIHVYVKRTPGKEPRKSAPSKEGFLGVEGMDADEIRRVFAPYAEGADGCGGGSANDDPITKADLFAAGLSGTDGASERRAALMRGLLLPENLSSNALLTALNVMMTKEEFENIIKKQSGSTGE